VKPALTKGAWWWKISVKTSPEAEEAVVELFQRLFEELCSVYTDAATCAMTVSTYLAGRSQWSASKRARLLDGLRKIRACGLDVDARTISAQRLRREDWAESWKRHFQPIEIGSALLIKPSWSRRRPHRGQAVVTLDPGLSFGTGQHPTTRFCLEQLVRYRRHHQRQSVLDIGTGSGILAIAAAKLGYQAVEGFDFDPVAVRIARANARRNGVARHVGLSCQDVTRLPLVGEKHDLICANLVAELLVAGKRRILARLKRDGILVLAGILGSEFEGVRAAYENSGLKVLSRAAEQEWESAAFTAN